MSWCVNATYCQLVELHGDVYRNVIHVLIQMTVFVRKLKCIWGLLNINRHS